MNDKGFIELIRKYGISNDIIKSILTDRGPRQEEQRKLYERYRGSKEGVPIKNHVYTVGGKVQKNKIDNKVNNDFFGDIIDVKTGFFAGIPIGYNLDYKTASTEAEYQKNNDVIQDWLKAENMEDLDAEAVKTTSICGESMRLLYVLKDEGNAHVANIFPWQAIVLYEGTTPVYGFYRYEYEAVESMVLGLGQKIVKKDVIEFYDDKYVTKFESVDGKDYVMVSQEPHLFSGCPMYTIYNNREAQGDCEKVLELIDSYDRVLSDWDNELEQFRLALMAVMGGKLDKEDVEKAHELGGIGLKEGMDIKFVTKVIQVEAIKEYLDKVDKNIYKFAQSINSQDENFAGTVTGVALNHKMDPLAKKCLVLGRKMTTALRHQFKLLCELWRYKKMANINYLELNFTFKRRYPQNLEAEADLAEKLKGIISDQTILENLSIVKDVQEELERIKEEAAERAKEINLDTVTKPGENTPAGEAADDGRAA